MARDEEMKDATLAEAVCHAARIMFPRMTAHTHVVLAHSNRVVLRRIARTIMLEYFHNGWWWYYDKELDVFFARREGV